jgi:hypothetical protein
MESANYWLEGWLNMTLDTIRVIRNAKLRATDHTQLMDAPLTPEQKQAYKDYRKKLRDLPQNISDINDVQWPEEPA